MMLQNLYIKKNPQSILEMWDTMKVPNLDEGEF